MWERARGCGRRPRFLEKMWPREQFHRLVGDRHLPLEDKQELGLVPTLRPGLAQVRGKLVAGLRGPLVSPDVRVYATLNLGLTPQVLVFLEFRIIYPG